MDAEELRNIEQRHKAVEYRLRGMTYKEIGEAMGISDSQAHRLVNAAIQHQIENLDESAEELRVIQMNRIQGMIQGVHDRAMKGDDTAVGSMLKLMEREALLMGLDKQRPDNDPAEHHAGIVERLKAKLENKDKEPAEHGSGG